jgi:hypothetical protein
MLNSILRNKKKKQLRFDLSPHVIVDAWSNTVNIDPGTSCVLTVNALNNSVISVSQPGTTWIQAERSPQEIWFADNYMGAMEVIR